MLPHPTDSTSTTAWRLWIDRCGGFGLVVDGAVSLGGARPSGGATVQVRSDWRRLEGRLTRRSGDYFWSSQSDDGQFSADEQLVRSGSELPVVGSATVRLHQPSPLSGSAVLALDPPHRFDCHVDQVLLVDQTVLIGPDPGNHIRCVGLDANAVLIFRDGIWKAKQKRTSNENRLGRTGRGTAAASPAFTELIPGKRISVGELDMVLEQA
ncbi:hypothetical protein [Stieleria tagensis]|uniref:hypothetical protein n=1 Tax=Stieleria tagensis TaxID=2956795 RepID=UPI00209AECB5|nr:hypothetical protein [Stieleria tagensis]